MTEAPTKKRAADNRGSVRAGYEDLLDRLRNGEWAMNEDQTSHNTCGVWGMLLCRCQQTCPETGSDKVCREDLRADLALSTQLRPQVNLAMLRSRDVRG